MAATAFAAAFCGARLSSSAASRASPLLLLQPQSSRRTDGLPYVRFVGLFILAPTVGSSLLLQFKDGRMFSFLQVRASSSEETSGSDELLSDLKEKWDSLEIKSTVLLYGGGAVVALWLSSTVVGAINSVPLLPKIMELVGLGYTGWFVYLYLLFKESGKELANDIDDLKKKNCWY